MPQTLNVPSFTVPLVAYDFDEAAALWREMVEIRDWNPPSNVVEGCMERVRSMRTTAQSVIDAIESEGNQVDVVLRDLRGDEEWGSELSPTEIARAESLLRGYDGGTLMPQDLHNVNLPQARRLYRTLRTAGCGTNWGTGWALFGIAAFAIGGIMLYRGTGGRKS